jgi:HEAT repeat protein
MNNLSQQPYKGLTPYEEQDQDNFFGRTEDIRILVDKIRARKLTFLFAASGVGKSSLLQAGVIPELKQPAHSFYAPLDVIYLRDWVVNPLAAFKQKVLEYFQRQGRLLPDAYRQESVVLKDFLNFCTLLSSDPLVIILDQFEEFFYYQRYHEEFQPFIEQLSLAIHDSETATVFVISMREDFALELNAFKEYMPTFLIENFYRLEKLTEAQTREAIVAPVTRLGVEYQPELLAALWTDLSRREQAERMGAEAVSGKEELPVEPPHLQIVCMQLWAHPETQRTRVISLAIYVAQGRAEGLLNHYFRKTIQNFSRREKKLASAAFDLLVSRYGTKLARPLAELATTLRVEESALGAVLKQLHEKRVLRQQDRQGKIWYELYHDVFAKHVYEWNEGYKRQQFIWRSLIRGGVVAVGLVGVVVGYDGWVNYTQVHLRLSPQSGVSDVIEVYQGKLKSFDVWKQQGYLYETDYVRSQIEADKLFNRRPVGEIGSLNLEVVEQWPVRTRVAEYGELGEFGKAFCLAEATLSQGVDIDLSKAVVADLPDFRTVESFEWLRGRYSKESGKIGDAISSNLEKMRPPWAILSGMEKDKEARIRAAVASILGKTGDKRAIKPLVALLKDSDKDVRSSAAEALGPLGSVEAVIPLVALLKDSEWYVRRNAAEALGPLGSVEAVTPLVALLKDSNNYVSRLAGEAAVKALVQLGRVEAVTPLVALLKDSAYNVRSLAASTLGQLGRVEAVTPLVALLKDSDKYIRSSAAVALGQLGSVEAVTPLVALLKDSDSDVRGSAAEALGQLGSVEAVTPLVALLKDSNSYVRSRAASALGKLERVEAVTPLVALLKDSDSDVRSRAADVLGQLGRVEAVTPLVALLKDSDPDVRSRAADVLGQLGSVEAVTPLVALLKDSNSYVRSRAAFALGPLGSVEAVTPLVALLKDSDSDVRRRAAVALGLLGSVEAVTPLVALLKDSDSNVRSCAASALGPLGSVEALTPLVALLKDSESHVRSSAAGALEQLGSVEALTPLVALLKDSESHVRSSAAGALEQLGSVEAVTPLVALLKDSDQFVRRRAVEALGQLGSVEAVTPLVALLKDSDKDVRRRAAEALGQLGGMEAVTPLVALLKAYHLDVRSSAAVALGQLGSVEAVTPLVALLKDFDSDVRRRAAEALGPLGRVEAVTPLVAALLKDSDKYIRRRAAEALGQLGNVEAVTPLVALLEDYDKDVRRSAAEALWRLGSPQGVKPSDLSQEESIKIDILRQIRTGQTPAVLPWLTQLYSRLNEDNIQVQRAVITALGEFLKADKKFRTSPMQETVATPSTGSGTSVTFPVTVKYKPSSEPLPDYKANIQAKLVSIINDSKAVFGLRKDALKAIAALGTEKVTQIIRDSIAQEKIGDQDNPLVFAAFQALGDNGHPAALPFLQQQLQNLTDRKQQWRNRRDNKTGMVTDTTLACDKQQPQFTTAEENTWQQESWEFELGYDITRLDPRVGIDKLLWHPLTNVRQGAAEGLAQGATGKWVAELIGQREKITQAGIQWVDEAIFVQAAYRAIDKMLRSLEETGTMEDLKALQGLKDVQDEAVKARVEWTVGVVGDKVGQ